MKPRTSVHLLQARKRVAAPSFFTLANPVIHPENIRVGMYLIAVSVRGEIREPVLDYTEAMAVHHHHIKFREIAGVPLEVRAVHFPFIITRRRSLERSPYYSGSSKQVPCEEPLDLRVFCFDRVSARYAAQLKPADDGMDLLEAYRIVNAHQEQMRREEAAQQLADREAARRVTARRK